MPLRGTIGDRGSGAPRGAPRARVAAGLFLVLAIAGCSRQTLVVQATVPLMQAALRETFASRDIETAHRGIPGQILLMRGLCGSDPGHREIWTTTVQLHASYAMIFVEAEDPQWAMDLYAEGKDLGLRFLRRAAWFEEAWAAGPDALRAAIAERQPAELGPLFLWTAACLGQHIFYHQDQPREMLDLPYVHVLLDAAIELTGDYFYGMPSVVKGIMLAIVPQGFGGNLEESERYFQKAFTIAQRRFLLQQVLYARHRCVAALDEERFVETLEEVRATPEDLLPEVRFINRLARRQAAEMLEHRQEYF